MNRRGFIPRVLALLAAPVAVLSGGSQHRGSQFYVVTGDADISRYVRATEHFISYRHAIDSIPPGGDILEIVGVNPRPWSCEMTITSD